MERSIVHIDMNTFFVSCERLTNSELNGIPLIIGGGERGVVASCSYEARRFGVRSAMPIHMAMKLCPQAKIMKGDMELYSRLSHDITQIIQEKAPVVEHSTSHLPVSGAVFQCVIFGFRDYGTCVCNTKQG